jgi:hypothetical protein
MVLSANFKRLCRVISLAWLPQLDAVAKLMSLDVGDTNDYRPTSHH